MPKEYEEEGVEKTSAEEKSKASGKLWDRTISQKLFPRGKQVKTYIYIIFQWLTHRPEYLTPLFLNYQNEFIRINCMKPEIALPDPKGGSKLKMHFVYNIFCPLQLI